MAERLVGIKAKMNGAKYREILDEILSALEQVVRLGRRFTFQRDNDPKAHSQDNAGVAFGQVSECP